MSSGIFAYRRIIRFTVCRVKAIPSEWFYDTLEQAKAAAGDQDIEIVGGANVVQQFVESGLVDEIQLHVSPVLLGGIRLFEQLDSGPIELERTRVVESPNVTHPMFRIEN